MSRQIRCPNCGGEQQLVNPGITMVICQFCSTTVYWGDDAVLQMGARSMLPEADTRLHLFGHGRLDGRSFQVVGHVRYDHGRGSWDEWYLQMDDGGVAWLSEDERELTHEQAVPVDQAPALSELRAGAGVQLGGQAFTVRELGEAVCIGGEGQLPFTILPGERYAYADVASMDGQQFATLEYDSQRGPTCFIGRTLGHEQLQIDDEAPPSTVGAHQGRHIECANCAAPLQVEAGREVKTQVCEYCGAQLDLSAAQTRVLGINPENLDTGLIFEVGQGATFYGRRFEVCGRMVYEDAEGYRSCEYLLHNPEEGYLWLVEENGHFLLNRPTQQAPSLDPFRLSPKTPVLVGETRFWMYESGNSRLLYVDGALPWVACSGDSFAYADLVAPPQMFGAESDGNEVEYFHGRYLPRDEVAEAFEGEISLPRGFGVHPAQPFVRGQVAKLLMVLGGLFALVNLGLLGWSASKVGRLVFEESFTADRYLGETVSRPFVVGGEKVMAMISRAPLNNSWMAVDVALLNGEDQVVMEVDDEISYYSGYEGGEHWTEGSRDHTVFFRAPPPGTYRLIIKGAGGTGNFGQTPGREVLEIRLYQGVVLSRYFLVALIITGLFPFFEILRKRLFEKRRWGPVIEDDDDDD